MSNAVDKAQLWVKTMISRESKGAGDTVPAMRRLSRRYGIPFSLLWNLRYRPPKDLFVGVYEKLHFAYEKELERSLAVLEHERSITKAKNWISKSLYRAANSLVSEENEQ